MHWVLHGSFHSDKRIFALTSGVQYTCALGGSRRGTPVRRPRLAIFNNKVFLPRSTADRGQLSFLWLNVALGKTGVTPSRPQVAASVLNNLFPRRGAVAGAGVVLCQPGSTDLLGGGVKIVGTLFRDLGLVESIYQLKSANIY